MQPVTTPESTPPTEVPDRAVRRTFTAEYKRRILHEFDACKGTPGAKAALLRREGLYDSRITDWRGARDRGELGGTTKPRGPRPAPAPDARDHRITELERDNLKLEKRVRRAEAMLELQKKVALLLETMSDDEPSVKP